MRSNHHIQTRITYNKLLDQKNLNFDQQARFFLTPVTLLVEQNPVFIPGHLELYRHAQYLDDVYLQKKVLSQLLVAVKRIFIDHNLRSALIEEWSPMEYEALAEALAILKTQSRISEKILVYLLQWLQPRVLKLKTTGSTQNGVQLRLMSTIDVTALKQEIMEANVGWWLLTTARQVQLRHHRDTLGVFLRLLPTNDVEFVKRDGEHESEATSCVSQFPLTHTTILSLAEQLGIGLSRVAIVLAKPYSQAFRHCEIEPYLVGRDRYHLVIQAGERNILSSGTETVHAREGEVWFFENKTLHRAHNDSSVSRIHIIFDGKPIAQ